MKGPCGHRVKLPPALLSTKYGGGFTLFLYLLNISRKAVNTTFYSSLVWPSRNQTRVYRFSSRRSIHSTTNWSFLFWKPFLTTKQRTAISGIEPATSILSITCLMFYQLSYRGASHILTKLLDLKLHISCTMKLVSTVTVLGLATNGGDYFHIDAEVT